MSTYDSERHHDRPPAGGDWPPLDQPSELVQRLRNLHWPEASSDARQRCWSELTKQAAALSERTLDSASPAPAEQCPTGSAADRRGSDGQHDRRFGRHDFAARLGAGRYSAVLGERVAATRGLATAARI